MSIPVLSGVGDALQWYQRNVTDPWSGSILQGLNKAKMGLGLGDQGSQVIDQLDPHDVDSYAFQDNPLGRFAYETATDPLNLVGTGLIPTGARALGLGGHALGALEAADKLPGAVSGKALDLLGNAAKGPIMDAAAWAEPHVAAFTDAHPDFASNWQTANQMWKSLNHMVLGYPLRNLVDDASRQAAYGDFGSARDIMSGFPGAVRATIGHSDDPAGLAGQAAQDYLDTFGGHLPHEVTDTGVPTSYGGELTSPFRRFQSTAQRLTSTGAPVYDAFGNPVMDPAVNGPKDWLLDKLSGADEWNKRLEQNQEIATRGPVWGNKAVQGISDRMDNMADYLDRHGASGATVNDFINQHGMMSPSELEARLVGDGISPADARATGESWERAVEDATGDAGKYVNTTQFQYRNKPYQDRIAELESKYPSTYNGLPTSTTDLRALDYHDKVGLRGYTGGDVNAANDLAQALRDAHAEQVLRGLAQNTFGGYKFATQNVPAFVRLAGEHPGLANAPAEYYRDSDIYNYQHGLPASFHGSMPIFGQEINPAALSSLAELVGAATEPGGEDRGLLGDSAELASQLGFGLNPLIRTGLQVTGNMGNNQESDLLRPLTAVSGAASLLSGAPVNVEQPFKNVIAGAEQALTGRETFPFTDYLVRKREAELAGTGNKWDATQTSGPIHDQALQDVAHQQGAQDLIGTLTPLDLKLVTPESQQVGRDAALANYYASRGLLHTAAANPMGHAYELADPVAELVARFETLPIQQRQALLRDPRALEMLGKQRMLQIHNPQQLAAG